MENIVKLYLNGEITIELLKQWFRLDLNICGNDSQCMGDNHVSSALSKCTTNLFAEQFIETLHSTFEWLTKQSTNVTLSRSKHIQTSVKNENSVNINYHDCFPTLDEALDKCQIQDNRTLKKRINPTLVSQKRLPLNENNSFRNIKNCVRNKSTKSSDYFKEEREMLKCFKMNIVNSSASEHLSQNKLVDIKKYTVIEPKYDYTSHRDEIIKLKTLYVQLLLDNQTLSLFEEIRFVLDVLNKRTTVESSPKHDNHTILEKIFSTYHNCFYMMYLVFEDIFVHNQLINFIDYKAYNQIFENYSLYNFKTDLESLNLKEIIEQAYLGRLECRTSKNISAMENDFVFFKPETDSKFNFPNDFSFSSFRKQRDEFYRLLKNYHENNWSSSIGSDRKLQNIFVSSIRYMLNMSKDVGNYYHLARLFVSQMIKSSQNEVEDNNKKVSTTKCDSNSASKIMSEQDKFKKLQDRFVKKPHNIDMHLTSNILDDSFNQKERFFRDFIYYLDSHSFNEQLKLILKNEIIKLTTTDVYCFGDSSLEDECDNNSFLHYLSHLNQLAKFLGFVCFYPMDTSINMERLNKNEKNDFFLKQTTLRSTSNNHLPILDIETYLLNSMENHILIIAVPWVVEFLMFIDQITLSMTYYENVIALLCLIYRYYLPNLSRLINQDNSQISYVRIFIQLYLEKLFQIKKFNVATHLHLLSEKMMNHSEVSNQMFHKITNSTTIDLKNNDFIYLDLHSEIFDMELIAEFFPHFSKMIIDQFRQFTNEIRKITPTSVSNKQGTLIRNEKFSTISIHPSSVIRSQVEESFLNIHSNSLKKCVHFLNDRISATCIKRIKCEIYPLVKNKHFELFLKSNPEFNRDETTELKKNIDLIVKLANTIRTECQEFVPNYSKEKIETIFPLIIVDDLDESVINFAIKMCLQHIKQRCLNWIDLNITNETIYSDIINFRRSQIITTTNDSSPSNDFQSFQLVSSVFQQYEEFVCQLRETLCDLNNLENVGNVECSKLISLMSNLKSIRNVSFLPSSNIKIIDMTTLDLAISVIAYKPMMLNDELLECFIQSWSEQSITFQRVICAKNLYMMSKSTSRISSWLKFESFLTKMLKSRLISFADIEEETFIILKQDWPTNVLNSFANLLNSLVDYAKRYDLITFDENGHSSNEILEWLSWFCTENNIH